MDKIKKNGIHLTPNTIVRKMVEKSTKYVNFDEAYIMENSCGSGNFLIEVVNKIVEMLKLKKKTNVEISKHLNEHIFGIELDRELHAECLNRLKKITLQLIDIECRFENVITGDTLKIYKNYIGKFDLVIGNPPYVRIHNMDPSIKDDFSFSKKGMTDLYLIFYEISLKMIKNSGYICYITPDSWSKSLAGKYFREKMVIGKLLKEVCILGHYNPFPFATTYTGIFMLSKCPCDEVILSQLNEGSETEPIHIPITQLYLDGSLFFNSNIVKFKKIILHKQGKLKLKNGVATLSDSFFISPECKFNLKRKIYKISIGKYYETIFPYDLSGKLLSLSEIKNQDPKLHNYILNNEEKLKNRSIENKNYWYGYGRSQGMSDLKYERVAVNNLFKTYNDVKVHDIKSGEICYSGLYSRTTNCNAESIKEILNTPQFEEYFKCVGAYKSGGYYTLKSKHLESYINFMFELKNRKH